MTSANTGLSSPKLELLDIVSVGCFVGPSSAQCSAVVHKCHDLVLRPTAASNAGLAPALYR